MIVHFGHVLWAVAWFSMIGPALITLLEVGLDDDSDGDLISWLAKQPLQRLHLFAAMEVAGMALMNVAAMWGGLAGRW